MSAEIFIALCASIPLFILLGFILHRRRMAAVAAIATQLGLTWEGGEGAGAVDGCAVRLRASGEGRHGEATVVVVVRPPGLPADLELRRPGVLLFRPEPVGDPAFDERVVASGPESYLRAVLDAPGRRWLIEHLGAQLWVDAGIIHAAGPATPEGARAALAAAVDLARRLSVEDPRGQVLRALAVETVPTCAAATLALVQGRWPLTPAEQTQLAHHRDPAVRRVLARALGAADPLAELAADPDAPEALRTEALADLAALDAERAVTWARLLTRRTELAFPWAHLVSVQAAPPVEPIERVRARPARVRQLIAEGLAFSTEAAEATLVGLLADSEPEVVLAAVESLAVQGTAACVPALQAVPRGAAGAAAAQAVRTIQARLGPVAGHLSLADQAVAEGGLSFARRDAETRTGPARGAALDKERG